MHFSVGRIFFYPLRMTLRMVSLIHSSHHGPSSHHPRRNSTSLNQQKDQEVPSRVHVGKLYQQNWRGLRNHQLRYFPLVVKSGNLQGECDECFIQMTEKRTYFFSHSDARLLTVVLSLVLWMRWCYEVEFPEEYPYQYIQGPVALFDQREYNVHVAACSRFQGRHRNGTGTSVCAMHQQQLSLCLLGLKMTPLQRALVCAAGVMGMNLEVKQSRHD